MKEIFELIRKIYSLRNEELLISSEYRWNTRDFIMQRGWYWSCKVFVLLSLSKILINYGGTCVWCLIPSDFFVYILNQSLNIEIGIKTKLNWSQVKYCLFNWKLFEWKNIKQSRIYISNKLNKKIWKSNWVGCWINK